MRDASLDEFLATDEAGEESDSEAELRESEAEGVGTGSETEAEPSAGSENRTSVEEGPEGEPDGPPPVADVEPARSTFAWSADGAACAACGERVEERWDSAGGLVCTACKEW